jgi:hypothetical protein
MADPRQRARFAYRAYQFLLRVQIARQKQFHRDLSFQHRVPGAIHLAESTLSEPLQQLKVPPGFRAGRNGSRPADPISAYGCSQILRLAVLRLTVLRDTARFCNPVLRHRSRAGNELIHVAPRTTRAAPPKKTLAPKL